MARQLLWVLSGALLALECATQRPGADAQISPSNPESSVASSPAPPDPSTQETPPSLQRTQAPIQERCGTFPCWRYKTAPDALRHVLERDRPRALGLGESHALVHTEHIASATSRFGLELLPVLADRTHDLVVELLAPPSGCAPATTEQVEREESAITEGQASGNQHQFVALGQRARQLGVVPHILRPSCQDLTAIAEAGDEGVLVMMETIARLTTDLAQRLLTRPTASPSEAELDLLVAYGGALHNDLAPRAGRESWSYGPALDAFTGGRYTELDLIVPEHIQDTSAWRSFPWHASLPPFDEESNVLLELAPRSWVLFFPKNVSAEAR